MVKLVAQFKPSGVGSTGRRLPGVAATGCGIFEWVEITMPRELMIFAAGLERSGATLKFRNTQNGGAHVSVSWPVHISLRNHKALDQNQPIAAPDYDDPA